MSHFVPFVVSTFAVGQSDVDEISIESVPERDASVGTHAKDVGARTLDTRCANPDSDA